MVVEGTLVYKIVHGIIMPGSDSVRRITRSMFVEVQRVEFRAWRPKCSLDEYRDCLRAMLASIEVHRQATTKADRSSLSKPAAQQRLPKTRLWTRQ